MEQLEIEEIPEARETNIHPEGIEIPRMSSDSLTYNEFFPFMVHNQPVIITGLSQRWLCSQKWLRNGLIDLESLKSQFKDRLVPVSNCSKQYFNSHEKKEISLHEHLSWWSKLIASPDRQEEELFYLKDWHLQREEEGYDNAFYEVPLYFGSDWLNEYLMATGEDDFRFVYMGPKGSWTGFHSDVYSSFSWSTNIVGRKRWIFLPAGEEKKLLDGNNKLPFSIDSDLLRSRNVVFTEILQGPHEAVFVPSGWFHQVWNLEDTISINHNWFNGTQIDRVYEALKLNLAYVVEELDAWNDGLEGSQEHYQVMLKASFGMNFKDFVDIVEFIARRRLSDIESPLESTVSFGRFCFGENHILFDLERISSLVQEMLQADEDLFSSEERARLEVIKESCLSR